MSKQKPAAASAELNPPTTEYEFLGPPGALFVTTTVPVVIYALYFGCSEANGCRPNLSAASDQIVASVSNPAWWKSLWDTEASLMYLAWYAFCVISWAILPGDRFQGTTLRTGEKKTYRINGFATFLLALGLTCGTIYRYGPSSFTILYEKWVGFVTASVLMATAQAVFCYIISFQKDKLLALGGNSGNFIYDFFIGRELNPSIGSLDLKSFNEIRPGLILWALIDISMACEQATRRGGLDKVTDSMWLVLAFQIWYVADALYNEVRGPAFVLAIALTFSQTAIFTTMDITTDGFGFMLSIGDLAWVPFTYSLQARYLAFKHVELGPVWTAVILITNLTGYYIFRDANAFRANLARLLSPLRRVRPRVPFYQLAAHRIPTLWSLYRGLLKEAPTEEIEYRIRMLFRQNHHLTGAAATKKGLAKGYKFLDAFKRANAGDEKQQAIMKRYSQALGTKSDKEYWKHLARNEMAWQIKLANRPIMTGGYLRPTFANRPLPRLKPQPLAITGMIRKRRAARERRVVKLTELQESLIDLRLEAEFESGVARLAGKDANFTSVYASHLDEWMEPLKELRKEISQTFPRDQQRRDEPYSLEMLEAIKAARREKIANKTRERERERRGEVLRRTILRQRKGPPAHVLAVMTPEQRRMDKIARSVSEVGYVAKVKRKLGFKLRHPDTWKVELGMSKEIQKESDRRMREETRRDKEMGFQTPDKNSG
ncbi:hypothetical protein D9615_004459 [Tricholomella constricta]|uniref:Uncharacterized protein n=1 Tax=Tricholomella constricta TaxID=117010 RepID=A0A8H5HES3_9AGAR|nr:hypothetical protein D9615_004459 [Tricholomella constricta]